jgi:radical SAM protein with 4Fe4S-binding SPASM domain
MPNMLEQEFSAIWTASALRDIAQAKKSARLAKNPECAECEFFVRCGMGCPARALIEAGDISAKDPLTCQIWQQRHQQRLMTSVNQRSKNATVINDIDGRLSQT